MRHSCDLERYFGKLLDRLPSDPDEEFEFTAKVLPVVEETLSSDAVVIHSSFCTYNDVPVDRIVLFAHHRTLRLLGLFLLSRLFHPEPAELFLNLRAEGTDIREILFDTTDVPYELGNIASYYQKATLFRYCRRVEDRWPLAKCAPRSCPAFFLTKGEFGPANREEWLARDRVRLAGGGTAFMDLAQVFLDAGRSDSGLPELDLESELGNGGVAPGSAELKVFLPGSFGWLDDVLPEPGGDPTSLGD